MPFVILVALVVAIPLLELYLLIEIGSEIGAIATIAVALLTAMIGGWLVRLQGLGGPGPGRALHGHRRGAGP